jgi:hypothetical protein
MADVITRLRLDSGEYDSKIKRATQGLLQMEQECRKVGGTLAVLEKDQIDFVRSLGQMQTVSTSVRGKIGELTASFTELSVQYKHLTDEEKKGDYGKALSASLEQLKKRINEAKGELKDVDKDLKDVSNDGDGLGGVMDVLAGKFGLSKSALGAWSVALGAATVAVKVAKDAFFENEQQLDAWGRLVESSKSVYEGFLNALNNGDVSGYINNINAIVRAASAAYDALDALNTFNAFNQVRVEKTRTAMTESIVDYREGNAQKEDVKAAGEAYKKELENRRKLEREAYLEAIGKVAAQRGISREDLTKALSGTYGNYEQLKNIPLTGTYVKYDPGTVPGTQGSVSVYKVAANEKERLGEALRQLNDTELQSLQDLGAQAERTGNEIAQVDRQLIRVLQGRNGANTVGGSGGSRGGRSGGGKSTQSWASIAMADMPGLTFGRSINDVNKDIQAAQTKYNTAGDEMGRSMAKSMIETLQQERATLLNEGDVTKGGFADAYSHDFGKDLKKYEQSKKSDDEQTNKTMVGELQQITGGVQGVMGGLQQLGVDIPEGLSGVIAGIQGVTTILTSIAAICTVIQTLSSIQTARQMIPLFAHGGIVGKAANGMVVPGNSFSGDNLRMPVLDKGGMIGVNSGELILNAVQSDRLAGMLMSRQQEGGGSAPSYVKGEDIYLGVNNYLRRKGKGELVTTR